jgi:hypothetical protein
MVPSQDYHKAGIPQNKRSRVTLKDRGPKLDPDQRHAIFESEISENRKVHFRGRIQAGPFNPDQRPRGVEWVLKMCLTVKHILAEHQTWDGGCRQSMSIEMKLIQSNWGSSRRTRSWNRIVVDRKNQKSY